jgi:PKD repeat protein
LYSNLDTIYKNIGTDTLKIDIAATIKNAVNFLSSQKVFWSISAAENNDMFVHQVSNLSNASDSLLLWVNPTLSETKFTFDLSLDYLDLYFKNQTITVVVTGKPNQKPLILDSIPEQIATIGKTFEPLYLPDYIKDDYTQFENLKIKADTNAYFNLTVKDGYLTATQTDGMFTGTTQTVLKVVDEAGLETDFGIQYTQPYLVNVPLKNVNPSASFYVSKVFVRPDDQVRFYTVLASTDSVFWDFSGGNQVSGTTVNPEVMFQKPGLYTITLTAKNENGVVSVLKNNYIVVSAMSPQDTTICKGDSVTITAIGAGFNAYAWNNDIFQPNPSIKVAPMQTTTYIVKMKKSLSIIIDSVIIHVATQPELGKDSSFCDGNTVRLNPGLFKSYYWNGLNTEGQSSYFDVTTGGKVTVKTIDSKGCVSSDSINLIVNPKPIVNLGKDSTFCWKDTITLNAGNTGSSFVWNTGKTTQTIIADTTKSYSVTVTNASKCSTSDTVQINVIVPIVPQIGVVTQSESGMNLIAWEPQFDKGIKLYHVWLESSTTGVFTLINTNAIDSLTYAIDLNSDPQTQSFNYALTSVDAACGNESYRSKIHSSIHLKCVLLDAKTVTATWNSYSGIAVTQYIIYRAKKGETIMPYDTINVDPGKSEIIYTDTNAIGLNSMYRVEFNLPNKVSPSKLKSDSGPFSQSLSNMAESQLVGIDITSLDASVKAYPNPANGIVYVSIQGNTPNEYEIELTDAIGRRLFQANTGKITDKTVLIESSSFASGMYMLKVISSNGIISKKIVITR